MCILEKELLFFNFPLFNWAKLYSEILKKAKT